MNRTRIIALLTTIAAFVIFFSCRKDEPKFSCDEKAHQYALMHQETNQTISRDSLIKLDRGLQFAVFRSLSAQNKKRIFNEKIDILLVTLDLKEGERTHLLALKNYFDADMYGHNEATPFVKEWELQAKNTLGWTQNMIQGMVGTWATPEELKAMAARIPVNTVQNKNLSPVCTCNYDVACSSFGDCKGGCLKSWDGCGIAGMFTCTGSCPEDRIGPLIPGTRGSASY
jgi:hypothetical protein